MNIINVGYDSTNYYLLGIKNGKFLIDSGFPGTLPKLSAELKRKGIALVEIKYFLATHYHPDHAGLAQELKNQGIKHIIMDEQVNFIAQFTEFFRTKKYPYHEIKLNDSLVLKCEESRKFMDGLGINGEIIHTPGHSNDSVTLILDEGFAFTGDLQPIFVLPEEDTISRQSWDKIHQHKITRIFPGHGG
ncbi:MAG TPA: MBL fold metallo-hydrolase [Anaerolineales bacterium]|nr:MBL fold metallo-hydrolase [Anaerolineales bacterium]